MSIPLSARAVLLLAACSAVLQAAAQTVASARPAPPDPLDAKAAVPAPRYASAFARFQRGDADKPVSWREANDTVARIGGWRVYAREAKQPDAAPAATPPAAAPAPQKAAPMPAGHGGHKAP